MMDWKEYEARQWAKMTFGEKVKHEVSHVLWVFLGVGAVIGVVLFVAALVLIEPFSLTGSGRRSRVCDLGYSGGNFKFVH
jgi:hypothetical protein